VLITRTPRRVSFFQVDIVDANAGAADDPDGAELSPAVRESLSWRSAPRVHPQSAISALRLSFVVRTIFQPALRRSSTPTFTDLICNNNFHRASSDLLADCALRRLERIASKRITVAASLHAVKLSARERLGLYGDQREHRFNLVLLGGLSRWAPAQCER